VVGKFTKIEQKLDMLEANQLRSLKVNEDLAKTLSEGAQQD